jgi:DNA-binding protein HU-beta
MNKTQLIEEVVKSTNLSKAEAGRAIDVVFQSISKALKEGEEVSLVGFGTFTVRERSARTGRNPQTGEKIDIKASKIPSFRAGKALKDSVN